MDFYTADSDMAHASRGQACAWCEDVIATSDDVCVDVDVDGIVAVHASCAEDAGLTVGRRNR